MSTERKRPNKLSHHIMTKASHEYVRGQIDNLRVAIINAGHKPTTMYYPNAERHYDALLDQYQHLVVTRSA